MGKIYHKDFVGDDLHIPKVHKTSHEKDESDEMSVEGLTGKLADIQKSYVNRGDPAAWDWTVGDFTTDDAYHELDLSAIVPGGAKVVLFNIRVKADSASKIFQLRKHGNTSGYVVSSIITAITGIAAYSRLIVACDDDRKVDYLANPATWAYINLVVSGWWF